MTNVPNAYQAYESEKVDWETQSSVRIITHYNPDVAKSKIKFDNGKTLGDGGFGARVKNDPYPFGIEADVPHGTRSEKNIVARTLKDVYVIGWSPYHLILDGLADGQNYGSAIVSEYVEMPEKWSKAPYGMKVRSEKVYYVVFANDPDLKIHGVRVRGTAVKHSRPIETALARAASRVSGILTKEAKRGINIGIYGIKVSLSVGDPIVSEAREGGKASSIVPLVVDVVALDDKTLRARLASGEVYGKLVEAAQSLKVEVDSTNWKGLPVPMALKNLKEGTLMAAPQIAAPDDSALDQLPPPDENTTEQPVTEAIPEPLPEDAQMTGVVLSDPDRFIQFVNVDLASHKMTAKDALAKLKLAAPGEWRGLFDCPLPFGEAKAYLW